MKSKKSFFRTVEPYLYLVPVMILFILFVFWPFVKTIQLSFARTTPLGQVAQYVGLDNYTNIFTDGTFLNSLVTTLKFSVMRVILSIVIGFILAIISTEKIRAKGFFRTVYALPMAISAAAASVVFMFIFHSSLGILNKVLGTHIGWLTDKKYALIAVTIVSVWMAIGMNFIYLTAAIQSVPSELYESVALDGANFFQKHRHVTIPSISPTLFFLLIINVINSVQAYAEFKMMTQGGPAESTNVIVYEIYQEAFINSRFGVACSESVIYAIKKNFELDMSDDAIAMSSGFPWGLGGGGCICGALAGATMCIGYFFGRKTPGDSKVNRCFKLSNEIHDFFKEYCGATCCRVLTKGKEKNSPERKAQCTDFVAATVKKTAEIILRELAADEAEK